MGIKPEESVDLIPTFYFTGLDMLPGFTGNNADDTGRGYTETLGKLSRRFTLFVPRSNNEHLLRLEFRRLSTLLLHVVNIILLCTQKEVIRIHARGVIAFMAHEQAIWNGAVSKFVANTTGDNIAINAGLSNSELDAWTPATRQRLCPIPAVRFQNRMNCTVLVYAVPETLRQGSYSSFFDRGATTFFCFWSLPIFLAEFALALLAVACSAIASVAALGKAINVFDLFAFGAELGSVRGIMGLHRNSSFLVPSLGTFDDVAGAISIGSYSFILAHLRS